MVFSNSTLIAFIVASATLLNVDAFAVLPRNELQCFTRQTNTSPLSVTMSSADTIAGLSDDEEPEAEDFLVAAGELDASDSETAEPSDRYLHAVRLAETRQTHRRHDKDTGSPEYQVAGMTERISYLTSHLKSNPKDFSTRRGLVALVNKRRRLLNYLFKEDVERYAAIIAALGIRHKAPGRVESREEKYANFPKQKSKKN